ncbi:hypothetical protein BYT27DRAFT_7183788 [Phlegmacium glaucopus]|nr:hypothetical protein BYT27DRAFT_7183788 [Phlegmacium glaucopus]
MCFKYYILYSTSQDKMYYFIEIHDEPDIKGSSKKVLEALKALAGRKKPAEDKLSWASKWQDLLIFVES